MFQQGGRPLPTWHSKTVGLWWGLAWVRYHRHKQPVGNEPHAQPGPAGQRGDEQRWDSFKLALNLINLSWQQTVLEFCIFSASGQSINPKDAGFVGRDGALEKQPFMVAFFKVSEVRIRSPRSAGGKRRQQNRNRSTQPQEGSRGLAPAGQCQCLFFTPPLLLEASAVLYCQFKVIQRVQIQCE